MISSQMKKNLESRIMFQQNDAENPWNEYVSNGEVFWQTVNKSDTYIQIDRVDISMA